MKALRTLARCAIVVSLALLTASCTREPERLVWDLAELTPLADRFHEVREIDFSTEEARRLMRGAWSWGTGVSGPGWEASAVSIGASAQLDVYLTEPKAIRLRFRCAPLLDDFDLSRFQEGGPSVTLFVNGHRSGQTRMKSALTEYQIPTKASLWSHGENRVSFRFEGWPESEVRIAWVDLRLEGARETEAPRARKASSFSSVILPFGTAVTYYLRFPPDSVLEVGGVRLFGPGADQAPGPVVELRVVPGAGSDIAEIETTLAPEPGQIWRRRLENSSSILAELTLRTPAPATEGQRDWSRTGVQIIDPKVHATRSMDPFFSGTPPLDGRPRKTPNGRPNIIIYLIDTLRADHLGAYGYAQDTSPQIDKFAADSVIFQDAIAQSSWTRAAVASLFTGLYAQRHGVNDRQDAMPPSLPVIAEQLQQAGYSTVGIITNGNVSQGVGFDRGFDQYTHLREQKNREIHVQSDRLNEEVFSWLDDRSGDRPFFLYLHTTDPHDPYTPRAPFRQKFALETPPDASMAPAAPRSLFFRSDLGAGGPQVSARELVSLYDAEIAFNDQSFGQLIERLRKEGLYDSSLIVLLSDHGEAFGEHRNLWKHGNSLYREEIRIPLIVKFPGNLGAGRRVEEVARQIDVFPTILELTGLGPLGGLQGRSLLPVAESGGYEAAPASSFSFLDLDGKHMASVRAEGFKLIKYYTMRPGKDVEIFELGTDPLERRDLSATHRIETGYLLSVLRGTDLYWTQEAVGSAEFSEELIERLKALGYLD